jgi:ABC-type amino acid transport substrate-binding protein
MSPQLGSTLLLTLHGVAVLGGLAWLAPAEHRRARAATLLLAALAGGVVATLLPPLSPAWVVPLQEGSTETAVLVARGEGGHAGPLFDWVYLPWLVGLDHDLGRLVAAQLAVSAGTIVLAARLLWEVTEDAAATAALLVGACLSLPVAWGALSEGPAPLLWPWLVWAALCGRERWGALGALASMALVAALRPELAGLGVVAAGAWGLGRTTWPEAAEARVRAAQTRAAAHPARTAGVLVGFVALVVATYEVWLPTGQVGGPLAWAIAMVHPLDPSLLALPATLLATVPMGLAALVLVGLAVGLRHPVRTMGVAVALAAMWRLYAAAAHGGWLGRTGDLAFFELVRYLGFLAPVVVGTAVVGWRALAARRRVQRVVLAACLVPPIPQAAALWPRTTAAHETLDVQLWRPVSRDLQAEVRFLLQLQRDHPDCAVVVDAGDVRLSFLGADRVSSRDRRTARTQREEAPLDDVAAALGGCVLVVQGHSCALGACDAVDGEIVLRSVYEGPPYAHWQHGWPVDGPVTFTARRW